MPTIDLTSSPLAPDLSPVTIHYRDIGAGPPLVVLHGGWGYEIYPFDRQIEMLASERRIVVADRSGYGRSGRLTEQAVDFHRRAAAETRLVIDALALDRPVLWGHSDGAVIALLMALEHPERYAAVIVEATHLYRHKPASRHFFETMVHDPDAVGPRVTAVLARDHGERWRDVIRMNAVAWLRLADERTMPDEDLYGGQLHTLRIPTLIVHGIADPRTEPGELDALRERLPHARLALIAAGGHSPHSERVTADDVTGTVQHFLAVS